MCDYAGAWIGSTRLLDQQVASYVSANPGVRRSPIIPISAEMKRSSPAVPKAVSVVAPGMLFYNLFIKFGRFKKVKFKVVNMQKLLRLRS